jgi:hypothetical protein
VTIVIACLWAIVNEKITTNCLEAERREQEAVQHDLIRWLPFTAKDGTRLFRELTLPEYEVVHELNSYFKAPDGKLHKTTYWGVLIPLSYSGAVLLRAVVEYLL